MTLHRIKMNNAKTTIIAKNVLGAWLALTVTLAFVWLPPAQGFPSPALARIVAIHLPNALVLLVSAALAGFFAWRYLAKGRHPLDDARSKTYAGLSALFCILTTATGSVFAKVQWGAYWNWDPKQICISLLLLIYAAYFVLRGSVPDDEKRGAIAGAYMLFASLMTPMLAYFIPKYMPSLHPTDTKFDGSYAVVISMGTLGLLGLMEWLRSLAVRTERARLILADVREAQFARRGEAR